MHRPFVILEEWIREGRLLAVKPEAVKPETEPEGQAWTAPADGPETAGDDVLFAAAMRDVRPLCWNEAPPPLPAPVEIAPVDDEVAALEMLREFCDRGRTGPEHLREYVEHAIHPAGRLYLRDLRSGRFAIQAHLDLHGRSVAEARQEIDGFIRRAVRSGYSAVRIVHGRGRHSAARPVMKENVERWLRHRRLARFVIAYTSARIVDGGGGAVYVLLRCN